MGVTRGVTRDVTRGIKITSTFSSFGPFEWNFIRDFDSTSKILKVQVLSFVAFLGMAME